MSEQIEPAGDEAQTVAVAIALRAKATSTKSVIVDVDCPFCSRKHVHGWAGGGNSVAHCVGDHINESYELLDPRRLVDAALDAK